MNNRRKQLVVDENFQYRFVVIGILASFLIINATLLIGIFVSETLIFNTSPKVVFSTAVALTEICCLIGVYFFSLKSSHRMAGPLFQIKQSLMKIGKGDLTTSTRLREADHFQDLGIQLNQTTEQLCESIERIKETADVLVSRLDDNPVAAETAQRLCVQLGEFKTHPDQDGKEAQAPEFPSLELAS